MSRKLKDILYIYRCVRASGGEERRGEEGGMGGGGETVKGRDGERRRGKGRGNLRIEEVVSPEWSYLVLSTHVPHSEANVLVFHCLHIETYTNTLRHI